MYHYTNMYFDVYIKYTRANITSFFLLRHKKLLMLIGILIKTNTREHYRYNSLVSISVLQLIDFVHWYYKVNNK